MKTLRTKTLPNLFVFLPIFAFAVDLFTPYLIWKRILPSEIRWLSHFTIAIMILLAVLQFLATKHIPLSVWLVVGVSIVWSYVAIGHEQGIPATLWGVWLLFQFPLIALFAYLQPNPPQKLAANIHKYVLVLLGIEVTVQLLQYASGVKPGDHLGGLFGNNGTGIALNVAIIVNSILLGYWIVSRRWVGFVISLSLGLISCGLGEVKLFPVAITVIGLIAVLTYAIKFRSWGRAFIAMTLIMAALAGFVFLYNSIVPDYGGVPIQTYVQDPTKLYEYLNFSVSSYSGDGSRYSDFGRMYALKIGWKSITTDPVTLLFGYGLGARSESNTIDTTGVALKSGAFGWSVGTSLLVLMQETGVVGLSILGCFVLWIIFSLAHDIREFPASPANGIRYALIFISLMWPILLWYSTVWAMRVPMIIYWYLLGFVLAESRGLRSYVPEHVIKLSAQGT